MTASALAFMDSSPAPVHLASMIMGTSRKFALSRTALEITQMLDTSPHNSKDSIPP